MKQTMESPKKSYKRKTVKQRKTTQKRKRVKKTKRRTTRKKGGSFIAYLPITTNSKGNSKSKSKKMRGGSTPQLPKGIYFQKGPGRYKYTAVLPNGKRVHFGHTSYQHYYDSVPANLGGGLWSTLNHLDEKRRDNYRKRHSGVLTRSGEKAYKREFSPSWFSYHFLW